MTRHYVLPPDQVQRAAEAGGPLAGLLIDPEKLKAMSIAVVEVDGRIVAYWVVWYGLHVEPLWIQEEFRRQPGVVTGLIAALEEIVAGTGEPAAFCVIEDDNLEAVRPYAARLGFHEAPGKLYYLVLTPAAEPVKG